MALSSPSVSSCRLQGELYLRILPGRAWMWREPSTPGGTTELAGPGPGGLESRNPLELIRTPLWETLS